MIRKTRMALVLTCAMVSLLLFGQDPDLVQVKGRGTGETEEAALKDAYRDAVETAVGLYVDAEQMVKNDQLIKDEILTQSNAYIEDYREIGRKTANGLTTITILAQVRKQKLTRRISGTMEAKTFKVGAGLKRFHAQETTVATRGGDGAAILKSELESWHLFEQLYEVTLASAEGVPVGDMSGDVVEIAYLFKMEVNRDKYFEEFVPRVEHVLSQISTEEPQDFRVDASHRQDFYLKKYISDGGKPYVFGQGHGDLLDLNRFGGRGALPYAPAPYEMKNPMAVNLITEANTALTVVKGKQYILDSQCFQQYVAWKYPPYSSSSSFSGLDRSRYVVKFCDRNGRSLAETEIVFGGRALSNELLTQGDRSRMAGKGESGDRFAVTSGTHHVWKITPWVHGDYAAYYQWFSFKLAKDDLPKVDTIKVELANVNGSTGISGKSVGSK